MKKRVHGEGSRTCTPSNATGTSVFFLERIPCSKGTTKLVSSLLRFWRESVVEIGEVFEKRINSTKLAAKKSE